MDVSHLLNPAGEPDVEIRHSDNVETDIASRSFRATAPSPEDPFPLEAQEAWLEEVINDPGLNGRKLAFQDREPAMRANLSEKIARLVSPPIVEVEQEMDLRTVPTKRKYKHTESFQEYRRHLNSGPAFSVSSTSSSYHTAVDTSPVPEITAALRSLPSFRSSASSYYTARTSRTPSTTGSRSDGPCITDINLLVPSAEQTIINGTLELKKLKRKDVKGTPLDYPPNVGDPLPPAVRELPEATQTYVKRGLAQGIWYGAIEQEMMRSNGDYRLPPVLVGYIVNQFFVRILLLDDTIYIERDGDNSSLVNLEDYLELFKDGRRFPHHLSTMTGARALMEHVFAACRLLMFQESALRTDPISNSSTPLQLFQASTQIGRTKSNVLAAGLNSATGDDASEKAGLNTAERKRNSTGGTSGGPGGDLLRRVALGQGSLTGRQGAQGGRQGYKGGQEDQSGGQRQGSGTRFNAARDNLEKKESPVETHSPPPSPPYRNIFPPSPPASPDQSFTEAWLAKYSAGVVPDAPAVDSHHSLADPDLLEKILPISRTPIEQPPDDLDSVSSFDDIPEEEVTEDHIKALESRYRFRCLSRDDFAQTLQRITA